MRRGGAAETSEAEGESEAPSLFADPTSSTPTGAEDPEVPASLSEAISMQALELGGSQDPTQVRNLTEEINQAAKRKGKTCVWCYAAIRMDQKHAVLVCLGQCEDDLWYMHRACFMKPIGQGPLGCIRDAPADAFKEHHPRQPVLTHQFFATWHQVQNTRGVVLWVSKHGIRCMKCAPLAVKTPGGPGKKQVAPPSDEAERAAADAMEDGSDGNGEVLRVSERDRVLDLEAVTDQALLADIKDSCEFLIQLIDIQLGDEPDATRRAQITRTVAGSHASVQRVFTNAGAWVEVEERLSAEIHWAGVVEGLASLLQKSSSEADSTPEQVRLALRNLRGCLRSTEPPTGRRLDAMIDIIAPLRDLRMFFAEDAYGGLDIGARAWNPRAGNAHWWADTWNMLSNLAAAFGGDAEWFPKVAAAVVKAEPVTARDLFASARAAGAAGGQVQSGFQSAGAAARVRVDPSLPSVTTGWVIEGPGQGQVVTGGAAAGGMPQAPLRAAAPTGASAAAGVPQGLPAPVSLAGLGVEERSHAALGALGSRSTSVAVLPPPARHNLFSGEDRSTVNDFVAHPAQVLPSGSTGEIPQAAVADALNALDDGAAIFACTEGDSTPFLTFMANTTEINARTMAAGFAERYQGRIPTHTLAQGAGGTLKIAQKANVRVRPLLRLDHWDLRQLVWESINLLEDDPQTRGLVPAFRWYLDLCNPDSQLFHPHGLGTTRDSAEEMHMRRVAKLYLIRHFIRFQRRYRGRLAVSVWDEMMSTAASRVPMVATNKTSAAIVFAAPTGTTRALSLNDDGTFGPKDAPGRVFAREEQCRDEEAEPAPAPRGDRQPGSKPPSGPQEIPLCLREIPAGVSIQQHYTHLTATITNFYRCANCGAENQHSAPFCTAPRRPDLPCAICFLGCHLERNCPCIYGVHPELWKARISDFYNRITQYKRRQGGGAGQPGAWEGEGDGGGAVFDVKGEREGAGGAGAAGAKK